MKTISTEKGFARLTRQSAVVDDSRLVAADLTKTRLRRVSTLTLQAVIVAMQHGRRLFQLKESGHRSETSRSIEKEISRWNHRQTNREPPKESKGDGVNKFPPRRNHGYWQSEMFNSHFEWNWWEKCGEVRRTTSSAIQKIPPKWKKSLRSERTKSGRRVPQICVGFPSLTFA